MHANEEYSRYNHLAPQSSKVKVGQAVSEGQEIAKVGMTGYTFHPHLHFQVFIFTGTHIWIDFDTVSVRDFISRSSVNVSAFLSTFLLLHRSRTYSRRQRQSTRFYPFIFLFHLKSTTSFISYSVQFNS